MLEKRVKEVSVAQIMHKTIKRIALSYQHKDDFSFWEPRAMAGNENLYEDYRIRFAKYNVVFPYTKKQFKRSCVHWKGVGTATCIELPTGENDMACQRMYFAHVYERGKKTACYLVMKMSRGAGIYAIEADGSYLFQGMAKRWRISEEKQIGKMYEQFLSSGKHDGYAVRTKHCKDLTE